MAAVDPEPALQTVDTRCIICSEILKLASACRHATAVSILEQALTDLGSQEWTLIPEVSLLPRRSRPA